MIEIIPAIDLIDGRCVRLEQGDFNRITNYSDDPIAQAGIFAQDGARWLHVVDLEGARSGEPKNTAVVKNLASEFSHLSIQVGGGIRSLAAIETLLDSGATRVVIGSKLVHDPGFARQAVELFGDKHLVAGVDAKDGLVATLGWSQISPIPAAEMVSGLATFGLRHLVYTDIARDGMQSGVSCRLYAAIAAAATFPVIVSGGVATIDDVKAAAGLGCDMIEGIIIGRALYEGAFSVKEALDAGRLSDREEKTWA